MIPEPELIEIIRAVERAAHAAGSDYFMVGASARDIVLGDHIRIGSLRATNDVDFVFAIQRWENYTAIQQALVNRPERDFVPDPQQKQRLLFRGVHQVDLVPFGHGIDDRGRMAWPPDGEQVMTVLGLEDALETATPKNVGGVQVRIPSTPALGLLKLISWNDRPDRTHDIEDFATYLRTYQHVFENGRLLNGPDSDLLEDDDFDYSEASYRIYGRDVGRMIRVKATGDLLLEILSRETDGPHYNLAAILSRSFRNDLDAGIKALRCFERGVREVLVLS